MQKNSNWQLEFVYNTFGQRVYKVKKKVVGGVVQAQTVADPWEYTYYGYDANGQVMTTYDIRMNNAVGANVYTAALDEQLIYGAGRLGAIQSPIDAFVYTNQATLPTEGPKWKNKLGKKNYELTNHLGNVNAVITDRKIVIDGAQVFAEYMFDNSTEGWLSTGTVSQSNSQLVVTTTGSNNSVYKTIPVVAGRTYTVVINATKGTAPNLELFLFGVTPSIYPITSGVTTSVTFTPTVTNANLGLIIRATASGSFAFQVQDVTVKSHAHYDPVVIMKSDYYPFGMQMPAKLNGSDVIGGHWNTGNYRFGYNGMEKDAEQKGDGNSYTTEFRQYDPRLGRWMSLDPLMMKFADMSPYCSFNNNPIYFTDPLGLDPTDPPSKSDRQKASALGIGGLLSILLSESALGSSWIQGKYTPVWLTNSADGILMGFAAVGAIGGGILGYMTFPLWKGGSVFIGAAIGGYAGIAVGLLILKGVSIVIDIVTSVRIKREAKRNAILDERVANDPIYQSNLNKIKVNESEIERLEGTRKIISSDEKFEEDSYRFYSQTVIESKVDLSDLKKHIIEMESKPEIYMTNPSVDYKEMHKKQLEDAQKNIEQARASYQNMLDQRAADILFNQELDCKIYDLKMENKVLKRDNEQIRNDGRKNRTIRDL